MRSAFLKINDRPGNWMWHNLPWLAVLALVFGFDSAEADMGSHAGDLDG